MGLWGTWESGIDSFDSSPMGGVPISSLLRRKGLQFGCNFEASFAFGVLSTKKLLPLTFGPIVALGFISLN